MATTSLAGQRAWVFGGTSGIGQACAQALAEAGAHVVVVGRSPDRLAAALAQLPTGVQGEALDTGDAAALHAALARHGDIDHVVVSLGGGSALGPYRQLDEDALRRTFENKFWQVQRATRAVLPRMNGGAQAGSVTWITGAAARAAIPGMSALAACNGALHAMVGPLARELAPLRVNAVSPGFIDTPYWQRAMEPEARSKTYESMAQIVPVKRVGSPQDVAAAVMLCVSNTFVTGAVIDCDGGRRLV
jgi:NAD(P)-dependent dehydrogenase (short-subunit alcohol dehydrogenase family)